MTASRSRLRLVRLIFTACKRSLSVVAFLTTLLFTAGSQAQNVPLTKLTIGDIQTGFADGTLSSEGLTRAFLERIERYEPFYNAFVSMNEQALAEAQAVDARRAAGEALGPLAGVPVVVKEAMDFAGLPSTAGWAPLAKAKGGISLVPEKDAPVVARLRAADAIILGKTNIPAFSADGTRANSSWAGPTFNAVNRDVAPGASSSGTAMAVAGGFAVAGLAEETGGSIQNPAAAQSLVGIKPTFGLVPNAGVAPLAGSTRDVVGPHAKTVTDAALMLEVLAGYTPEDPKTVASIGHRPEAGYAGGLSETALQGVRVGLYGPGWRSKPLTTETQSLYRRAAEELEAEGATVVEDPFAGSGFAELAKLLGGYDPRGTESLAYDFELYLARLGPSAVANSFAELVALTKVNPFDEGQPLADIPAGLPVLRESLKDPTVAPDLSAFLELRETYLAIFDRVMAENELDVLVFPQMGAEIPGIFAEEAYDATTVSEINIAGLPGVTVPAGAYESGAPFGLIFVGPLWSEAALLGYAFDYEQATRHRIIPELVTEPYDRKLARP